MKTRINYILLTVAAALLTLTSCDKFLDVTNVEQMTFDKIWERQSTAEAYLATVYGYMPDHSNANGGEQAIFGVTDESSMSWPNYKGGPGTIANGTWGPSLVRLGGAGVNGTTGAGGTAWKPYYQGIREALIFMKNIDRVPDNEISAEQKTQYKWEARFLRAYYYASLMRFYGPVVLLGEEPLDPTASQEALSLPRNSWDECMSYVLSELNACANALPVERPSAQLGRPTRGAALATIARLTLYSARPLLNGNPMYANIANKDGKKLFPATADNNKWKTAADAAKAVIDMGVYDLYKSADGDPYKSYAGVFYTPVDATESTTRWNSEIILGRNAGSGNMALHLVPRGGVQSWGSYGGWGPTQQQVDAYAMNSGKYPITGYSSTGIPSIDPTSGYTENEWGTWQHPFDKGKAPRAYLSMYKNREPRFYVTVFWNADMWYQAYGQVAYFHTTGNSGPPEQDHARTGYLNRKWVPNSDSPRDGVYNTFSWPYIRYAEVLLNYIEALNEYSGPGNADIKKYWNMIRSRSGLPNIETVYPDIFNSKELVREYILKERRIELAFEGHRYFDTRTWMMKINGQSVDSGPMYGMNVAATNSDQGGAFWQRMNTETRVFRDAFYLLPISQDELNKNHNLVQNYGW